MAEPQLDGIDRALVVGLGRSGMAAITALRRAGVEVVAVDEKAAPSAEPPSLPEGVRVHLGVDAAPYVEGVDLLVPSPVIPESSAVVRRALDAGVPVWSEPELGWRLAPRRVVGITGTNGKTTVTELTAAMLSEAGLDAVACGNIGNPFTTAALAAPEDRVLVAELSSFQLRFCHDLRPGIGVLLNLEADHLDWHGDLSAYGEAKARMWRAQREGDWAVVNADDDVTVALARAHAPARVAWFSGEGALMDGRTGVERSRDHLRSTLPGSAGDIVPLSALALDAPHYRANVAASACAALLAGADPAAVGRAAAHYRPGPHRLEDLGVPGPIRFVDDSKATNVGSTEAALRSFEHIVWIAGGLPKGQDLSPLGECLGPVRHAVLIGTAAPELEEICRGAGVPATRAGSMEEAVAVAVSHAQPGDTVLLSPACASFDMFEDYADRGERFAEVARALARDGGGA